jgi:cytoskeletal protein RodZ
MSTYSVHAPHNPDSGAGFKLLSVFLGLVVVIMGSFGLWLALSAQHASDDAHLAAQNAKTAQPASTPATHDHTATAGAGVATPSFAGAAPANAADLATAHVAFPATLPAAAAGAVVQVEAVIEGAEPQPAVVAEGDLVEAV